MGIITGLVAVAALSTGWWWFHSGDDSPEVVALAGAPATTEQVPALRRVTPPPSAPVVSTRPVHIIAASAPAAYVPPVATRPAVTSQPASAPTTRPVAVATHPTPPPLLVTGRDLPFLRPPSTDHNTAASQLREGLAAKQGNDLLRARALINEALHGGLTREEQDTARRELADLAAVTLFSRKYLADDALTVWHSLRSGDTVGKLAKQNHISQALIVEMNSLRNANFVRQGIRLKLLKGPFHAEVVKRTHQMHLYLQGLYVKTMPVALGQDGSTPTGLWRVANNLANPAWTDPQTGKRWHPDDPANPIGEYWIGLEGIEGEAVGMFGYGIHGTIEPETIGQDASLGCVRLKAEDIATVYRWLLPEQSYVYIRP